MKISCRYHVLYGQDEDFLQTKERHPLGAQNQGAGLLCTFPRVSSVPQGEQSQRRVHALGLLRRRKSKFSRRREGVRVNEASAKGTKHQTYTGGLATWPTHVQKRSFLRKKSKHIFRLFRVLEQWRYVRFEEKERKFDSGERFGLSYWLWTFLFSSSQTTTSEVNVNEALHEAHRRGFSPEDLLEEARQQVRATKSSRLL